MRDDLRERYFTPFVLPVTIIGIMLVVGISLSRILLAVSEYGAAFIAMLAAGYVMAIAFFVEARRRITARALGIALAIGLIGLMGAGAVAAAAGMRPLGEEEHGGGAGEAAGGEGGASNEPVFVAVDIAYESAPSELPPGDIDLTLENDGAIEHDVTIEELGDERVLAATGGETDEATVALEAGEYTYYCSVTGHREAGMEGTLTVSEDVEAGGAGGSSEAASEGGSEAGAAEGSEAASDGASEG